MLSNERFRTIAWILLLGVTHLSSVVSLRAENRITYQDHVRPIFASNCLSCHNPDKREAGLDLSTFRGVMAGGSGGKVLSPGNANSSRLFLLIGHQEEPAMPPNQSPLASDSLELVRAWITQGCRESKDSATQTPKRSTVALEFDAAEQSGIINGYPHHFPKRPFVQSAQRGAVNALAAHPGADWVALAGQSQILAYDLRNFELLGVLPFQEGMPRVVRFSQNGALLLAAGGVGATAGDVRIWNATTGGFVGAFGEEYDEVLAADIDASQQRIALGGPAGLVKIHAARSGELLHRHDKHTDWITGVAYSPDGILLATADRAGGLFVWEAETHAEFYTLKGHSEAITDLSWRADSNVLATCDDSGQVFLWEMHGGKKIKRWKAHDNGALCIAFARDGRLVTGGRDKQVRLWDGKGGKLRDLPPMEDVVIDTDINAAGTRIIAADLHGTVRVFNIDDGTSLGDLKPNPPKFTEQRQTAQMRFEAADANQKEKEAARKTAEEAAIAAQTKLNNATLLHQQALTVAATAEKALQQASANLTATEASQVSLSDADATVTAALTKSRESLEAARSAAQSALNHAQAAVAAAAQRCANVRSQRDRTAHDEEVATQAVKNAAQDRDAMFAQLAKWSAGDLEPEIDKARQNLSVVQTATDTANHLHESARNQLAAAQTELSSARIALADISATLKQRTKNVETASQAVSTAQTRVTEINERLTRLQIVRSDLAEVIDRLMNEAEPSDTESNLPAVLQKTQDALGLLEDELRRTRSKESQANDELFAAQASLSKAKNEVESAKREGNALPQIIADLEARVAAAESTTKEAELSARQKALELGEAAVDLKFHTDQRDQHIADWITSRKKNIN